ncbi:MAG: hypothetical protein JXR95_16485 [Deltaproteobacteria bacterium]|nr:hypothetical protein [Deltaproteobacteria bacterium]
MPDIFSFFFTDLRYWILLLHIFIFSSCVSGTDEDRSDRYNDDSAFDYCSIGFSEGTEQQYRIEGFLALENNELWKSGPFYIWNTSPSDSCENNPVTTENSLVPQVKLYTTFPVRDNPLRTGSAEVSDGPFPLVVFAHANNDSICNIFQRYYTLTDHLASWGFIVVSVDSTSENCTPGSAENLALRSENRLPQWSP